ncbi:DNA/RNA non-specific endonuclease [Sediminibacillus halophilus]|uniref:Predicted ribonuclease, toxin component of the YeeF-YezG toxin-antitoxin module n=1 Tax=Sediminibacillus halophilus TaxID=482461 RepID=A0A1G9RS12_9BACI|nr:DNA/RNA non-specific endonuclease [Sediminibacillus halophilus]SDM25996.1 Predicted ribonuclease, toxin component of the YeeF-YezG toxin-antitoxin module [Sediminibacillus halophilus]
MDVKYIPADWDRMKDGLGDLIGLGRWGKGMIDDLKDITENLEDAESDIAKYDRDGVISFSHIDREGKYQSIFEDFKVLHDFSGKVGDIVDRTIDDPFHEDIDKFVTTMRDATISNYTTKNRIDATEQQVIYQRYGMQETREVPKAEVSLDDLLSGDNFYAEQLQVEYDMWKAEHPDQDFTQEEYRMAAVNMNAFEYESIKDQQHSEEFWANLGALVVIVSAAVICPPAGLVLGAVYGSMELKSAISGEDWISGRELGTGERWLRGALSPLDIVPGVAGLKKFSSGVRVANQAADMGQFGLRSGIKTSVQRELKHVGDMVTTAGRQSTARLKSAGAAVKDRAIRDAISAGKAADSMVTSAKNITSTRNVVAMDELGKVHMPAENTHFLENKVKDTLSKAEGVSVSSGAKGIDNGTSRVSDNIIRDGSHLNKDGTLKPNIKYQSGEYNYQYKTDELGRLTDFNADDLKLTKRDNRLSHKSNTPGKEQGDHAGHLAADRFGGSPVLDNLVSQSSSVNLSKYKKLENQWAKAIKEGKDVSVNVKVNYEGNSLRPSSFDIEYEIDGRMRFTSLEN